MLSGKKKKEQNEKEKKNAIKNGSCNAVDIFRHSRFNHEKYQATIVHCFKFFDMYFI